MYSKNSYLLNLSQTVQRKLKMLRLLARSNQKGILEDLIQSLYFEEGKTQDKVYCSFCNSTKNITREHVVPRWVFEKNTVNFFTTDINGFNQTYNKSTIPACKTCNSEILSSLEIYILQLFNTAYPNISELSIDQRENIIRWMEIIDYKFHVLNTFRKFKAHKVSGYIPYLENIPLLMLKSQGELSEAKITAELRRSFARITIKNKHKQINSLVLFKITNEGFHFFHTMDEFIFIEFPKQRIALFYFYTRSFETQLEAKNEAMKIIESVYKKKRSINR